MGSNDCPSPFTCEISEPIWKGPLFPRNARPSPGKKVFISTGIWSLPEKASQLLGENWQFIQVLNCYYPSLTHWLSTPELYDWCVFFFFPLNHREVCVCVCVCVCMRVCAHTCVGACLCVWITAARSMYIVQHVHQQWSDEGNLLPQTVSCSHEYETLVPLFQHLPLHLQHLNAFMWIRSYV